jgi:hypothetical protein
MHAILVLALQAASPYVPLDHWSMPYLEHLIARGVAVDPAPLSRPLRAADVVRALRAVDSAAVTAAEWRVARRIAQELEQPGAGPFGRVDGHVGIAGATHPLRDPLETRCRPTDSGCVSRNLAGRAFLAGGLAAAVWLGPLVAATHPYFDTRLKVDPDYKGKQDRIVTGRNAEAYLSTQWRHAELFFGALDRNWGFGTVPGLILSPSPYSYEHVALAIGPPGMRLEGVVAQLDDIIDSTGTANTRYFVAHRLVVRPSRTTVLSFWEGTVWGGPGRQLEPWYANILNLGLLAQYDQGTFSNNLLGLDVRARAGGVALFGSLLLDDFQIDRDAPDSEEPPSLGITLAAAGRAGPAAVTAWYTRIFNLTYRTPNPTEAVMRSSVGLARNFSDYDQLTARAGLLVGADVLLQPEVTVVRQGEGDFRRPYPPLAAFGTTPTFLAGTVERTVRLALGARVDRPRLGAALDGGVHLVSNANHVAGQRDARFVGRIELSWRFRQERALQ